MIARIWRGWTTPANADRYEDVLMREVFPGIVARKIDGFRGIRLLRADRGDEVEFVTIMSFDSRQAIRQFVGDDIDVAYVPEAARHVLARWDERVVHYEERASLAG